MNAGRVLKLHAFYIVFCVSMAVGVSVAEGANEMAPEGLQIIFIFDGNETVASKAWLHPYDLGAEHQGLYDIGESDMVISYGRVGGNSYFREGFLTPKRFSSNVGRPYDKSTVNERATTHFGPTEFELFDRAGNSCFAAVAHWGATASGYSHFLGAVMCELRGRTLTLADAKAVFAGIGVKGQREPQVEAQASQSASLRKFDGHWVGAVGDGGMCGAVTIDMRIVNGVLSGTWRIPTPSWGIFRGTYQVSGEVGSSGRLVDAVAVGPDTIQFSGRLAEGSGRGAMKGSYYSCTGDWEITRVERPELDLGSAEAEETTDKPVSPDLNAGARDDGIGSIEDRLRQLKRWQDEGLIPPDEAARKRKELLDQL